jgi:hypothetical protein
MDYWDSPYADERRGGPSLAARRWAGHVRAFVAGVAITSLVAFLLVRSGSTDAQHLSVGNANDPTDSVPSTATPNATSAVAAGDDLATCTDPEQGVASTPTQDELVDRLVGTWLVCNAPSVFGTNEVGMQIGSDGRWWKLGRNPAGQLTPMPGWGDQGSWDIIDTSGMNGPGVFQVNFHVDGSGTVVSLPVFSSGPPKIRLNNMGVYVADYVPAS